MESSRRARRPDGKEARSRSARPASAPASARAYTFGRDPDAVFVLESAGAQLNVLLAMVQKQVAAVAQPAGPGKDPQAANRILALSLGDVVARQKSVVFTTLRQVQNQVRKSHWQHQQVMARAAATENALRHELAKVRLRDEKSASGSPRASAAQSCRASPLRASASASAAQSTRASPRGQGMRDERATSSRASPRGAPRDLSTPQPFVVPSLGGAQ